MQPLLEMARSGVTSALSLLCMNLAYWLVFVVARGDVPWRGKLLAVSCYAAAASTAMLAGGDIPFRELAIGLVYFALLSAGLSRVATWLRAGRISAGATFLICLLGFQLLPALCSPGSVFLMLGWSMALSGYSYCVDTAQAKSAPSTQECLFFVLVNPALVYQERGRSVAAPALHRAGLVRAMVGATAFAIGIAVLKPALNVRMRQLATADQSATRVLLIASSALLWFASEYALHAGLASVRIGLLRQLGREVPEGYHYPWMASGPADFWRRWNLYLGAWVKRYVFYPVALRLGRNGLANRTAQAVALIAAFGVVGMLHDEFVYASSLRFTTRGLEGFTLAAATVLLSVGAGIPARRLAQRLAVAPGTYAAIAVTAARAAWIIGLIGTFAWLA